MIKLIIITGYYNFFDHFGIPLAFIQRQSKGGDDCAERSATPITDFALGLKCGLSHRPRYPSRML